MTIQDSSAIHTCHMNKGIPVFRSFLGSNTSRNGKPGRKWQATDGTRSSKSVGFQELNDETMQLGLLDI